MHFPVLRTLWVALSFSLAIWVVPAGPAQERPAPSRYELGQRLRRLERIIADHDTQSTKQLVRPYFLSAVQSFFRLDPTGVARSLDQAYLEMLAVTPANEFTKEGDRVLRRKLAPILRLTIESPRFVANPDGMDFQIRFPFLYPAKTETAREQGAPDWAPLQVQEGNSASTQYGELDIHLLPLTDSKANSVHRARISAGPSLGPHALAVTDQPPGDYELRVSAVLEGHEFEISRTLVSWVPDANLRLTAIESQLERNSGWDPDALATVQFGEQQIRKAIRGHSLELDFPVAQRLRDLEAILDKKHDADWMSDLEGEHWLVLRGQKNGKPKGRAHLRVWVPPPTAASTESHPDHSALPMGRPCVIALHGAGGSENMFFDAYGDGGLVELCAERGWVFVAPRAGFTGIGIPFHQLLDRIKQPLNIDPARVFLVGHSMGVSASLAALAEVPQHPEWSYRGVAAIGGGAPRQFHKANAGTPFLVITGKHDFARKGAISMHERLQSLEFSSQLIDLEDVEHMGVVQFSLDTVVEFFEACLD